MTTFLSSGTWYFVVTAIDEDDLESDFSDELEHEITFSATLTGTATANVTESQVVTGGLTIIITLSNDTWVAEGATFDAQRQNIIDGLVSAQSDTAGFNEVIVAELPVTAVVRTSATVVTITLTDFDGDPYTAFDITQSHVVSGEIPGTAVLSGSPISATGTITIGYVVAGAESPTISYVSGTPTIGYAAGAPTIEAP